MKTKLIIDGNAVYEVDEECLRNNGCRTPKKEKEVKKQNQKGNRYNQHP